MAAMPCNVESSLDCPSTGSASQRRFSLLKLIMEARGADQIKL